MRPQSSVIHIYHSYRSIVWLETSIQTHEQHAAVECEVKDNLTDWLDKQLPKEHSEWTTDGNENTGLDQ